MGQPCSWAVVEQRSPTTDVLSEDDAAWLHCLGRAGHDNGRLTIAWEQGNTVSNMVRNGNIRGKGESLALGAHRRVGLGEDDLIGGEVELDGADEGRRQ